MLRFCKMVDVDERHVSSRVERDKVVLCLTAKLGKPLGLKMKSNGADAETRTGQP